MKGILLLEDGSYFEGISIGTDGERIGEVILNTAVVGYQEIMSDPANAGKILILTYPLIGNYGVAEKFSESKGCWVEGIVIKEESAITSNWQAEDSFGNFLQREAVVAISGIDTRTAAIILREKGEMLGIVSSTGTERETLFTRLKEQKKKRQNRHIQKISVTANMEWHANQGGPRIGVLDLGVLSDFLRQLKKLGASITLLPYSIDAYEILSLNLDGLLISGGPEEDEAILDISETVAKLLGKIPMMGISLGHEIIGLALGAKRKRMKLGHRGVNYPVCAPGSYKGEITVQNHVWVLDSKGLEDRHDVTITLRNVNDQSIEEMESRELHFIATQYYPVSPGFDEVHEVFVRFMEMIDQRSETGKS